MSPKSIIALDLDGTLLTPEGILTERTIQTIQQVKAKGHTILIVTGRPYRMAKHFYHQLELDTPMINFNGSLTHIPEQQWQWEKSVRIDKNYFLDFLSQEDPFQADFIAGEYKNSFCITQKYLNRINPELLGVEEIGPQHQVKKDQIRSDFHSILMQTRAEDKYALAEEIRRYFRHELEISTWGGPLNILETCAKGVTKGFALRYLLEVYQADRNQLISFGDEQNDVTMFQLAGTSYAMKNANPLLLSHADHQTAFSNAEDGVARQLEELFL